MSYQDLRILITNDDGVAAPGLAAMIDAVRGFGRIKVVAPDRERSACGHSMTMRDPLRLWSVDMDGVEEAFAVNGVPVDCVSIGREVAWPDGVDLLLSGINSGPNLGFDVTYSGTVAGAMEGAIHGILSIAVSMAVFVDGAPLHLQTGCDWLRSNLPMLLDLPRMPLNFLNVNIPAIAQAELAGHRFVGMGQRVYEDRIEQRSDPWGRPYFWQGGVAAMTSPDSSTDVGAVSAGFVAITPITLDWSNHALLQVWNARTGSLRG